MRGICGKVGDAVTAELAFGVGRALASEGYDRVVVGRDARKSGIVLADALSSGLRACGADVVRVGVVTTPTLARGIWSLEADAGVTVTASHNPPEENGLKLWNFAGQAFDEKRRRAIERRIHDEDFSPRGCEELGTETSVDDLEERHLAALRATVSLDKDLSVVVDSGNGPGRLTVEALRELGCSVTTLNAELDGRFPTRPGEPTAEDCEQLRTLVGESDADLGIAHDGDADRMMAVTDEGEFVPGDTLLALFGQRYAEENASVAAPLNASRAVDRALDAVGASVVRTQIGDDYVAEKVREPDVVFGGEPSGAWIWPDESLCPDGPLAACRLTELVADCGPLSDLVSDIETFPTKRTSIEAADKEIIVAQIAEDVRDQYGTVETKGGVRVETDDGWFLVRASGTEPLVRVTAEANDERRAAALSERAVEVVHQARNEVEPMEL